MSIVPLFFPPRPYRWNFAVMAIDVSLFQLGTSFASVYVILPLFVQHLTDSNLALGAISALRAGGMIAPILVAGRTERLSRKKGFVVGWSSIERFPYLVLAVATPLLATAQPIALLWLCFAMLALNTLAAGAATPAWLDMLSRMMPDDWRGRFFGVASAVGGLLGVAGGAGAAALLQRFPWQTGIALCFACTSVALAVSFVFLTLGREPAPSQRAVPAPARETLWRRVPELLRQDANLRWYILALSLITAAGAATAFYAVDAKGALGLTDAAAGRYAVVLLATTTAGSLLWGYAGDHWGHKRVVVGGALCSGLAALLALLARDPRWGAAGYGVVFLLVGLGTSALQLAAFTFIVDLAPIEQRPTYIGLTTLAQAPWAFGVPLLAGLAADRYGYPAVFVVAAVLALAGAMVVLLRVADLRMHRADVVAPAEVSS
ncbi:MAG: hypothetical protein AVDCRST_MAG88-1732 [uncultured Thermomicrobiales bacterium]|uniref:Major facilitator superfamily (MFS) profile domain-containing protein n=1 Tax=uncultured Thermomicrobiales bacterium TaxID=1645740 RepID=A0A6J4V3R1_9BACT|nr:MAG: hypothetical protein AVDCRST_MAG88-1732 [uncultured Thermomicrobiales bacterium]